MKKYIATFFSHFGALRFLHLCRERGWHAQLAPVPRSLSSSCGTCVLFQTQAEALKNSAPLATPELEQLVQDEGGAYAFLYRAEE